MRRLGFLMLLAVGVFFLFLRQKEAESAASHVASSSAPSYHFARAENSLPQHADRDAASASSGEHLTPPIPEEESQEAESAPDARTVEEREQITQMVLASDLFSMASLKSTLQAMDQISEKSFGDALVAMFAQLQVGEIAKRDKILFFAYKKNNAHLLPIWEATLLRTSPRSAGEKAASVDAHPNVEVRGADVEQMQALRALAELSLEPRAKALLQQVILGRDNAVFKEVHREYALRVLTERYPNLMPSLLRQLDEDDPLLARAKSFFARREIP